MNAFSDENLMNHVARGEVTHLGILFERHHKQLFNYFLRLTAQGDVAEDLTQDVFYRILKYRNTYADPVPFRMWLYRIARNVANDHFGKKGSTSAILDESLVCDAPSPESQTHKSQQHGALQRAFAALTPEKREVLVQSRFLNMKYAEIARISDSTVAAVKVRVHRAVNELKNLFHEQAREEMP